MMSSDPRGGVANPRSSRLSVWVSVRLSEELLRTTTPEDVCVCPSDGAAEVRVDLEAEWVLLLQISIENCNPAQITGVASQKEFKKCTSDWWRWFHQHVSTSGHRSNVSFTLSCKCTFLRLFQILHKPSNQTFVSRKPESGFTFA